MINTTTINDLIGRWLLEFTGIQAIRSQGKGTKPDTPYLTLRIASLITHGVDYVSPPDNSGMAIISGVREMIVNVQCYGLNAFGILENVSHLNVHDGSQVFLKTENITFITERNLLDISGLNEITYEDRATTDLLFRFGTQYTGVDVGLIEVVEIEGIINTGSSEKIFNFEVDLT